MTAALITLTPTPFPYIPPLAHHYHPLPRSARSISSAPRAFSAATTPTVPITSDALAPASTNVVGGRKSASKVHSSRSRTVKEEEAAVGERRECGHPNVSQAPEEP